jgi:hypothetical protein
MSKEIEFKNFVKKCIDNNQYVGLGNPNSNILIIGKEAGFDPNNKDRNEDYKSNAIIWQKDSLIYTKPFLPEDPKLRDGRHTWQKYQKLYNDISNSNLKEKYYINFVGKIFTTELSNLPFPNTQGAKENIKFKEELLKRKQIYFDSDFIRSFPIVIIPVLDSNYISNNGIGSEREIDNIFKVEFNKEVKCKNSKDKYWIHYSAIKGFPKIVIQTRQFTNGASNELLKSIALEIKEFAINNSIEV